MRFFWFLVAALVLAACVITGWWWWQGRLERSQEAPIKAAAKKYGVEPALLKAVVWRESRFDPGARGRAMEIGLMQLREEAAQEWADSEKLDSFVHEHCLDPGTNTMAGAFYLSKLLRRYQQTDNPAVYGLADYNAGRANVLKWNKGEAATNSAVFLQQMTFPGTRDYIQAVLQRRDHYR